MEEYEKAILMVIGLFLFWLGGKLENSSNRFIAKFALGSGITGGIILAAILLPLIFRF